MLFFRIRPQNPCLSIFICSALCGIAFGKETAQVVAQPDGTASAALLVGCTKYDLNEKHSLVGPANDVDLMFNLLVDRFGFPKQNIHRLTENRSQAERPTRSNILREMQALIDAAQVGQKVVLFFAGHGCQQPDHVPPDPNDPEPDGLDEVFLPCDIGLWNSEIQTIQNAIIDDEFRVWIGKLLAKEVELLVIFDSCHSGGSTRGTDDEQSRRIDPVELVPADVLANAISRNKVTRGGRPPQEQSGFDVLAGSKWVALYASLPEECTVELKLPRASPQARRQGLFTYSLCQTLRQSTPTSYRELIQRIRASYLAQGRFCPTPLVEGNELDRGVLGGQPATPSYQLERDSKGQWLVSAGQLHGCTAGSIFAVRESNSNSEAKTIGFVQVVHAGLSESKVKPCAYLDKPLNEILPIGGLCRLVYVDYGDHRLRVAIDEEASRGRAVGPIREMMANLSGEKGSPIAVVERPDQADWILVNRAESNHSADWVLAPRSEMLEKPSLNSSTPTPAVQFTMDPGIPTKATETFQSIARASALLGLAARFGSEAKTGLNLEYEVMYQAAGSSDSASLTVDRPNQLPPGGKIHIKLNNRGRKPVDFTLLFVDSSFGIHAIFPRSYSVDNRLPPGKQFETKPMTVTANTIGREHVVLIAVPAQSVPKNFTFLAQPTLESAKREKDQQRSGAPDDPLDRFLEFVAYRSGDARGMESDSATNPIVQVRSWIVTP